MYGVPDWTDVGLIGYNSVSLNGVDTILVVYHDEAGTVHKISPVYLTKPVQFESTDAIASTVAEVAPEDGVCADEALTSSGLGSEVHSCSSESLKGIYTDAQLKALGVKGEYGVYSYSVDPTVDEYYEIEVQFGSDTIEIPPTPVPTTAPVPTAAPTLEELYPPVVDVRELAIGRGYEIGDSLSVSGSVFNITVDSAGTYMQIWVTSPDGTTEAVQIYYEGDSAGLFEGSWVIAYGNYAGPSCGTNMLGGQICQPAILAEELVY